MRFDSIQHAVSLLAMNRVMFGGLRNKYRLKPGSTQNPLDILTRLPVDNLDKPIGI
jgi:hypothetical protein